MLLRFFNFRVGGRLSSRICLGQIWTNHKGYLVVFITVQNLVAIDAVFRKYESLNFYMFDLKRPIHAPKIGVLWEFYPFNGEQYQRNPQKTHPCTSPRCLSHQARKSADL